MKNLRKSLIALALVAGVTGAVASNVSGKTAAKLVDYSWTHYDTDGTTVLQSGLIKSPEVAKEDFGCQELENVTCAIGTREGSQPITLYYQ